ncbi:MAG: hypothetical protein ACRET1_05695, partial [Burkholderiales bacterium]
VVLWLARRLFGARIQTRTAGELTADSRTRHASKPMPGWAQREIRELVRFEPALRDLIGRRAHVGEYFIPWNMVHVGHAYALARRQLKQTYACMVLTGSTGHTDLDEHLKAAPRPAVIIDVDAEPALQALSIAQHVDYLALAEAGLNVNERAALLTRLVVQLHPAQLWYARTGFLDVCLRRHGLAMRSMTLVRELPADDRHESIVADGSASGC